MECDKESNSVKIILSGERKRQRKSMLITKAIRIETLCRDDRRRRGMMIQRHMFIGFSLFAKYISLC